MTIKMHPSKKVVHDAAKDLPKKGKPQAEKEFAASITSSAGKKKTKIEKRYGK